MNNLTLGGWDTVRGRAFAYYETIAGGMGASAAGPGLSATHTHMTNSWNTPTEAFEHQYPLRIRAYRIRKGSGGRGRHAGGDSIVREFEFLTGGEVTILSDRRERGPYGLAGGGAGKPGRNTEVAHGRGRKGGAKEWVGVAAGGVARLKTPAVRGGADPASAHTTT